MKKNENFDQTDSNASVLTLTSLRHFEAAFKNKNWLENNNHCVLFRKGLPSLLTGFDWQICFKTATAHAFVKWPFNGWCRREHETAKKILKAPSWIWKYIWTYEHKDGILVHNYGEDQFPDMGIFSWNKNFSYSDPFKSRYWQDNCI